jgi:dihydrofolate reductase
LCEQAKQAAGEKNVYLDGGNVITQALDVGCVDELILTVVPALLGQGVPLYQGKQVQRFNGEYLGQSGEMTQIKMVRPKRRDNVR